MSDFFDFHAKITARKAESALPRSARSAGADGLPADVLTVAQLTDMIDAALKKGVPSQVLVRGQISNYKAHGTSGHVYLTLKDQTLACIDCVMYKADAARLRFTPTDGMEVLAAGRVGVYANRGRYQLYVRTLQPIGQGALEIAFQQMKAKLQKEGLFDAAHKRPLPPYPLRVALLTSSQTAALQDMLKVLRRYRFLKLYCYHVPVQGESAAGKIAEGIAHLCDRCADLGGMDVIILARGGGSLEDLWPFNEEAVARAIHAAGIPIITGIGHETDVSIADLVADYHAHTPTEAAQVVVSRWRTARDQNEMLGVQLRRGLRTVVQSQRQWLSAIERHEAFRRPLDRVNQLRQAIDDAQKDLDAAIATLLRRATAGVQDLRLKLEQHRPSAVALRMRQRLAAIEQRLHLAMRGQVRWRSQRLNHRAMRLEAQHPRHGVRLQFARLGALVVRLRCAVGNDLGQREVRLDGLAAHLRAIGPQQVLGRGYTITTLKKGGTLVRSAEQVKPGDRLISRFADGQVESVADDSSQPRLFE